jgi:hypothetical protein
MPGVVEGGREGSGGGQKGCYQKEEKEGKGAEEEGSAHHAELWVSPTMVEREKRDLEERL